MKAIYKLIPLLIVIVALAGCSMDGETATIRLSVGQAAGARAVSLNEVSHTVALSGPTGGRSAEIGPGGGSVLFTVAPGAWTISVTGYYQGQVYSTGSATANVAAGKTTSVSVQMTVVYVEAPTAPVDTKPLLSAQGFEFKIGCSDFLSLTTCAQGSTVWATAEPGTSTVMLGSDDFTWQWNVDGTLVVIGVDPLYPNEYLVQPGNDHKKVTVIATHPDYQGSVTLGPVLVCQIVDSFTWESAINAKPDGSFVLSPDTYSISNVLLSSPFTGYFDGNGETISFSINIPGALPDNYGLFAEIGATGIVKNFNLSANVGVNPNTFANELYNVGSVAGVNRGSIRNVSVVLNTHILIQGYAYVFNARAGGVAGYNTGSINNCSVTGYEVRSEDSGIHLAGGIAGLNEGQISFCWINTDVIALYGADGFFGGIAGQNSSSINNCVVLGGNIAGLSPGVAGRIWSTGSGSGSGNYATTQVQLDGSSYTNPSPPLNDGTTVNYNVLSPTPPDAGDELWWYDTGGLWESVFWGGEETPWVWDISGYPVLWF